MQAENHVRVTKSLSHGLHVTRAALAIAVCCRAGTRWARRALEKVPAGGFWSWGKDRSAPSRYTCGSLGGLGQVSCAQMGAAACISPASAEGSSASLAAALGLASVKASLYCLYCCQKNRNHC